MVRTVLPTAFRDDSIVKPFHGDGVCRPFSFQQILIRILFRKTIIRANIVLYFVSG